MSDNPLRVASGLLLQGKTTEAIACLEAALARTRSEQERPADAPPPARTAGLYCDHAGLLPQAARYYEEAVATAGAEPLLLLALAEVRWKLGEAEAARAALAGAEVMVESAPDADVSEAIAHLRARWESGG